MAIIPQEAEAARSAFIEPQNILIGIFGLEKISAREKYAKTMASIQQSL
jgi:hypothetical protein